MVVIAQLPIKDLLKSAKIRAEKKGWNISAMKTTDQKEVDLSAKKEWPQETSGSLTFSKVGVPGNRTFFWSTYEQRGLAKVNGGLYIKEYVNPGETVISACRAALSDLYDLFGVEESLCMVITLEDDEGVDVAPTIIGKYRLQLWDKLNEKAGVGLIVSKMTDGWVEATPDKKDFGEQLSVYSMSKLVQETILRIQSKLENIIWD